MHPALFYHNGHGSKSEWKHILYDIDDFPRIEQARNDPGGVG